MVNWVSLLVIFLYGWAGDFLEKPKSNENGFSRSCNCPTPLAGDGPPARPMGPLDPEIDENSQKSARACGKIPRVCFSKGEKQLRGGPGPLKVVLHIEHICYYF